MTTGDSRAVLSSSYIRWFGAMKFPIVVSLDWRDEQEKYKNLIANRGAPKVDTTASTILEVEK